MDGTFAAQRGGRWTPSAPDGFPTVHLNADRETARANVRQRFEGQPFGPDDLDPEAAPVLVTTEVPPGQALDAVAPKALTSLGLPMTYPRYDSGKPIPWEVCQAIGAQAFAAGLDGIACISAARGGTRELAWFPRGRRLPKTKVERFAAWYFGTKIE